jgi:hypothetical protein
MHACASTYVALCGIWVLLLGLYIVVAILRHTSLDGVVLIAAILAFTVAWVRSFKIEVSSEGIRYRSPFFRHASLSWSSIASVNSGVRWQPTRSPFYMVIKSRDAARPITINIKVFGRTNLSSLAAAIRYWSPQATVDETTARIRAGQMPSLTRAPKHDGRTG